MHIRFATELSLGGAFTGFVSLLFFSIYKFTYVRNLFLYLICIVIYFVCYIITY